MSDSIWRNQGELYSKSWRCGHCGCDTGSNIGFRKSHQHDGRQGEAFIYICMRCEKPTYFAGDGQVPPPQYGATVNHLPPAVESAYAETRNCFLVAAYTAAALMARKLLMNVANHCGAPPGQSFVSYVKYLSDNHYVPPRTSAWVDHIREMGNDATHEIPAITKDQATDLLMFVEMLLKLVFEFPEAHAKAQPAKAQP